MTISRAPYRSTFIACLLLVLAFGQQTAQAGPMYIFLHINPPTTAGFGVPAANGMTVTSSKFGAGTFQLYAVDDVAGSFGIRSYSIKLNGTITTFLNRSPNAIWTDIDEELFPEGFNAFRTTVAATGTVSAAQGPTNPMFIGGFGISASNFVAANPSANTTTQSSSGRWGVYSASYYPFSTSGYVSASGHFRNALLLAEGNYTGAPPTVNLTTPPGEGGTSVTYFTQNPSQGIAVATATSYSSDVPFAIDDPEPATVTLVGLAFFGLIGLVRKRC